MTQKQKMDRYILGWKSGAAFLPVPDGMGSDIDFVNGWAAGRTDKKEMVLRAEKIYGVKATIFTLAETEGDSE